MRLALPDESDDRGTPAGATLRPGAVTALLAEIARCELSEAPPALTPGTRVGRYEIIRPIGRGGFGAVYEAHDAALHRLVALKVLHRTPKVGPESASEGEAAARLAHPNIAALHDAGVLEGGAPYLVYELLHGETLESRLGRGPIPPDEALAIAAQVARALAHAHGAGVVHRDLKPANVFLTVEGDVKVLDFGLALLFGREGPAGGTPAYMSPEQGRGEPEDARTDLYALGLMLREMLTGERGTPGAEPARRVPHAAGRVLAALLAENPTSRPRSARVALAGIEAASRAIGGLGAHRRAVISAIALVLAATLAALLLRERPPSGAPMQGTVPSIAVLPFADLSPQHDQEYFSDGLSEEILNALARLEGLRVVGRTSSFSFKGKNEDLETIARKLHVTDVLEGSVRREGSRVRITAQLVATSSGHQRWSETYDRELTGVFALQEEIARAVVDVLKVKLLPGEAPSTEERSTTSLEAYHQYLLGRHFALQGTVPGWERAIAAFEKAVAADPGYAPAWASMSDVLTWYGSFLESEVRRDEYLRRAMAAAEKAIRARPRLADGYAARGFLRTVQLPFDWDGAEADLRRALELNPRDATTLRYYGTFVAAARGRLEEGIAALRRSTESDPLYAPGWLFLSVLCQSTNLSHARAAIERALELAPENFLVHYQLASILLLEGKAEEARAAAHRISDDAFRAVTVALAEHSLGHAAESDRALGELTRRHAATAAYQIAEVHAWRGERERAFEWLERAYAQHDGGLGDLLLDPMFRSLHGDPRWAALLRKVGLVSD